MTYLSRNTLFGLTFFILLGLVYWATQGQSNVAVGGSQDLTLSTGATKRIAGGRAKIWLGEVGATNSDGDQLEPGVEFELTCNNETHVGWAIESAATEEICGFRVRLLEELNTTPPSARIEVTWAGDLTTNQQAASKASMQDSPIPPTVQRPRATP